MNNAPVSMSKLLIPLKSATARNARRQAASAPPNSEAAKTCPGGRESCVIVELPGTKPGNIMTRFANGYPSAGSSYLGLRPSGIQAGREFART
jgi:hypothetical protein